MNGTQDPQIPQNCALPARAGSGRKRKLRVRKTRPLTYEIVREMFEYHEDGYLIWSDHCRRPDKVGRRAGWMDRHGYYEVMIYGKAHKVHRVIYMWHHGYMPEGIVDHEDRDKLNNKIENLREVSVTCNNRNCEVRKDSKTGVCGVFWHKQSRKWEAKVRVNRVATTVGRFSNFDEAVKARHAAEIKHNWKGCNSTSSAYLYLKERGLL